MRGKYAAWRRHMTWQIREAMWGALKVYGVDVKLLDRGKASKYMGV